MVADPAHDRDAAVVSRKEVSRLRMLAQIARCAARQAVEIPGLPPPERYPDELPDRGTFVPVSDHGIEGAWREGS
jgi:hypothetical protein